MKLHKIIAGLAVAAGAFSMASCSEDFEVAAPYKDVTVVYGFLNPDEAVQYIRIQKASMDENQSAVDLAKNPDSNYYRNLEVHVREFNNGTLLSDDVLNRVDMANENLPKDPGTYFQAPSYAYKYTRALTAGRSYRLVVLNQETGKADSAETTALSGSFNVSLFNNIAPKLNFANTLINNNFEISVTPPAGAKYLEGYLRFKYTVSTNGGPQVDSSLVWKFATAVVDPNSSSSTVSMRAPRPEFYAFLNSNIKQATGVARYIDSSDVYIWVANQDFYNYLLINNSQGGITADQIKANYTNVKGEDALGLFSSRAVRIGRNIPFDQLTLDSLRHNPLTRDLGFNGFADH